jgi:cell filamentation protein
MNLKAKFKREGNQLGSVTTQFKFVAPDGKKRAANVLDYDGIIELAKNFLSKHMTFKGGRSNECF